MNEAYSSFWTGRRRRLGVKLPLTVDRLAPGAPGQRCRRRCLDLDGRSVRIVETVYELGQLVKGTPKSRASVRKVPLPELIIADLRTHVDRYAALGLDGFVFVGVRGGQLRRSNFSKTWAAALAKAGLPAEVHVHDLRHTGNTFAAERRVRHWRS